MTTGVVTFSYQNWSAEYPELGLSVSSAQATGYFNRATLQLDNTPSSVVQDASIGGQRESLLYLLVSHLVVLGQRDPNQVGRVSDAAQGSVHVAFENAPATGTAAYYQQTRYGAEFWAATTGIRFGGRYYAPYQPFAVPSPDPTIPEPPAGV